MDIDTPLQRLVTPWIVVLAVSLALGPTVSAARAADVFQSSCKSTCGNGATCFRLAKHALADCAGGSASAACVASYDATRLACKAEVERCRGYCRSCAPATADPLQSCRTSADPPGCAGNAVAAFFRCLRDGTMGACAPSDLATPAEIAASPFADAEAELLAIEASGAFVAPADVYGRIAGDLALIRATTGDVQGIEARADLLPDELLVGFDAEGKASVDAGTYHAWDCVNAAHGMTGIEDHSTFVTLHFAHRFDTRPLATVYQQLPHVSWAGPNALYGDGNDVCASIQGETYHYVFDAGSGDCPAGCIDHTYLGFSTSGAPGEIVSLGSWSRGDGPTPPWFMALAACARWLGPEALIPPG